MRHEIDTIDADSRIDVHLLVIIRSACLRIGKVLDIFQIVVLPDMPHLVKVKCMAATIIRSIPAAHQLLIKGINVATVSFTHLQVTISMELGSRELCVGVNGCSL